MTPSLFSSFSSTSFTSAFFTSAFCSSAPPKLKLTTAQRMLLAVCVAVFMLLLGVSRDTHATESAARDSANIDSASTTSAKTAALQTVTALLVSMEKKDAEGIRAAFAKGAAQTYQNGLTKSDEAFHRWLEANIIKREGRVEQAQVKAEGNNIIVTGMYKSKGYVSPANFLMTVENGLITHWEMRY